MKLLETKQAPNARRVRMFLAEKKITLDTVELDLKNGDNLTDEFKAKNPFAKVPVLELDDGSCISESVAICRYFEELHPEPALMGTSPLQKAQIEMWQRRAEFGFLMPVGMAFQHCSGFFKDRMTPRDDWGKDCIKSAYGYLKMLDEHLAEGEYLAGRQFSIADITMLTTLDFAKVIDIRLNEKHSNLQRWYELVSSRESAKA
ncbi:MAG: glutathione S-transferase family protein [Kangiellaceae bacterium]|nr:glutathione S-transferase family protein [Kangiellaceae bacterium]